MFLICNRSSLNVAVGCDHDGAWSLELVKRKGLAVPEDFRHGALDGGPW